MTDNQMLVEQHNNTGWLTVLIVIGMVLIIRQGIIMYREAKSFSEYKSSNNKNHE